MSGIADRTADYLVISGCF